MAIFWIESSVTLAILPGCRMYPIVAFGFTISALDAKLISYFTIIGLVIISTLAPYLLFGKNIKTEFAISIALATIAISYVLSSSAPFCPANFLGLHGFLGENPSLDASGSFSFLLEQLTGRTLYNIALSCVGYNSRSTSNATALIYSNGTASSKIANSQNMPLSDGRLSLQSGQKVQISELKCIGSSTQLGAEFDGSAYINYTSNPGKVSESNPWISSEVGSFYTQTR